MLIHLSKFEFHSKGKQIIAVQDIENKTPLHPREIIFALTLAMLAQIPVPSSNHSKYLCFRIYSFSLANVSYFSFFFNSSILHSFVPDKPLLSAKNCQIVDIDVLRSGLLLAFYAKLLRRLLFFPTACASPAPSMVVAPSFPTSAMTGLVLLIVQCDITIPPKNTENGNQIRQLP